jgi:hypothetical protein
MTWAYRMRVSLDIDYMTWDFHNRTWAFIKDACLSDVSDWRNVGVTRKSAIGVTMATYAVECMPQNSSLGISSMLRTSATRIVAACLSYAVECMPQNSSLGISSMLHAFLMPSNRFHNRTWASINTACLVVDTSYLSNVCRRIDSVCRQMYPVESIPQQDLDIHYMT